MLSSSPINPRQSDEIAHQYIPSTSSTPKEPLKSKEVKEVAKILQKYEGIAVKKDITAKLLTDHIGKIFNSSEYSSTATNPDRKRLGEIARLLYQPDNTENSQVVQGSLKEGSLRSDRLAIFKKIEGIFRHLH